MDLPLPPEERDDAYSVGDGMSPSRPHPRPAWPTVLTVLATLGCATALLLTGQNLDNALAGTIGIMLIGGQVARRIVADAGPLPAVIVASAVAVFGAVLITVVRYDLPHAVMGAGIAGLVAGEIAGRLLGGEQPRGPKGV